MRGPIVWLSWAAIAAAVGLALPTLARADALRYTVTDFGADTYALGMNNLGQVFGIQNFSSGADAPGFLYSGGTKTLGTPSDATAINDSGQLARQDPASDYLPLAINASGTTAGVITGSDGDSHPGIGTAQNYSAIPGIQGDGWAYGINNSGQVVGWMYDPSDPTQTHAFLYSDGKVTDLGAVVGAGSAAVAINNLGQVVGNGTDPATGNQFPFLYSGGKVINLGSLDGHGGSGYATGINDLGQIIGMSSVSSTPDNPFNPDGFLYQNGIMTDLTKLLQTDYGININPYNDVKINNMGQLLITTFDDPGMPHSYLLTPTTVPEPTTIAIFACAGIALARQRRKVGHRDHRIRVPRPASR